MKALIAVLACLTSYTVFSMKKQQQVAVHTVDNKVCILPLWQVRESTTLHRLFLAEKHNRDNPLRTLKTTSLCFKELELFKEASEQSSEKFPAYFHSLTPEHQRMLIIATGKRSDKGEKKLNAQALATQLVSLCLPADIIQGYMCPLLGLDHLVDHFKNRIVDYNFAHQQFISETITDEKSAIRNDNYGRCTLIPWPLKNNNFCAGIRFFPTFITGNDSYTMQYRQKRKDAQITYCISSNVSVQNKNECNELQKKLWLVTEQGPVLATTLEHPYPIDECVFSRDGKFLASTSNHEDWAKSFGLMHTNQSCLLFTTLGINPDGSDFVHTVFNHNNCNNTAISFNPQSTMLAAATTDGVYIWSTNGIMVKHLIDDEYHQAQDVQWNCDGTTLCVLLRKILEGSLSSKLVIYTVDDNFTEKTISLGHGFATSLHLLSSHNSFATRITKLSKERMQSDELLHSQEMLSFNQSINERMGNMTSKQAIVAVDAVTGDCINFLEESSQFKKSDFLFFVISPDRKFLAAAYTLVSLIDMSSTHIDVVLYDLTSNEHVVFPNQPKMAGIGFTPDGRSMIIINNSTEYTLYHLYDNSTHSSLEWLRHSPTLFQRYALLKWYTSVQNKTHLSLHPQSALLHVLDSLEKTIKEFMRQLERQTFYDGDHSIQ